MGSITSALSAAASSMRALEQVFSVIENNVANASTPGFAAQEQVLTAGRFNAEQSLAGGLELGPVISYRSTYAEESVWRETESYGWASQQVSDLSQIEPVFSISENTGISGALSNFYQSISSLSVNPNDSAGRQVVLERAMALARSFNQTVYSLSGASLNAEREAASVVAEINRLIGIVRDLNVRRRENFRNAQDAGLDAQLHQALEELSELADFNVLFQPDGSVSLFLNGQEAMLVGDRQYLLQTAVLDGKLQILDFEGNDLAGQTKSGRLGALLELRNSSIPSYEADLNNLAQALADRVNGLLAGGVDLNGQPPAKNLFTYDATVGAAISLRVTDITGAELAMALPSAPGGNGNALLLAELSNSIEIDGYTFTEYYGNIAARVGRQLDTARSELDSQESLLTQARSLREEVSGVSLDAEAAKLVQFQRNYEAVGRLLTVLDELTETIIGLVR